MEQWNKPSWCVLNLSNTFASQDWFKTSCLNATGTLCSLKMLERRFIRRLDSTCAETRGELSWKSSYKSRLSLYLRFFDLRSAVNVMTLLLRTCFWTSRLLWTHLLSRLKNRDTRNEKTWSESRLLRCQLSNRTWTAILVSSQMRPSSNCLGRIAGLLRRQWVTTSFSAPPSISWNLS